MVKKIIEENCGWRRKKRNGDCAVKNQCTVTPLSKKSTCGRARVCGVNGDRKHCARLAALGLYPGNEIELLSLPNGDQCIIKVHGGTITIDRNTTEDILITE